MKKIAVYGSLKKGKFNHSILEGCKFLGTTQVTGTLYNVSSYPALCESGNNKYDAEIYDVPPYIYEAIRGMELGAGYKEVIINVGSNEVIVYYADSLLDMFCKEQREVIKSY
jgi:gamma-glutamylcyclotransferase (GGCT)/AIG2-like uncharacterized protein YtfP